MSIWMISLRLTSCAMASRARRMASSRVTASILHAGVDRSHQVSLDGDMAKYVWAINGQTWPNITPLQVKQGERVELVFTNRTGMSHPMHLHGMLFRLPRSTARRSPAPGGIPCL
jgi:FtsP/CotA-like multicopper oxidase with cupredoxin domain